jgi:hypothetical protein
MAIKKGIVPQTIKDVLQVRARLPPGAGALFCRRSPPAAPTAPLAPTPSQSLVDDDMVHSEKIGISNYFWAFPAEASVKVRSAGPAAGRPGRALRCCAGGGARSLALPGHPTCRARACR